MNSDFLTSVYRLTNVMFYMIAVLKCDLMIEIKIVITLSPGVHNCFYIVYIKQMHVKFESRFLLNK